MSEYKKYHSDSFSKKLCHYLLSSEWDYDKINDILWELEFDWIEAFQQELFYKFPEAPHKRELFLFIQNFKIRLQFHEQETDVFWEDDDLDDEDDFEEFIESTDPEENWQWPTDLALELNVPDQNSAYNYILKKANLPTEDELKSAFGLCHNEIAFLSDCAYREAEKHDSPHQNYHYFLKKKRHGLRLIEIPKPMLKHCQQVIHRNILTKIPVHPAACAYQKGKSIVDFAKVHCQEKVLLKMDLENFFTSIPTFQVFYQFSKMGYSDEMSRLLSGFCLNDAPKHVTHHLARVFKLPHLPQGAPTSPALSNLCFYEIDRRLALAAKKTGINYSRYADDLAFSGDFNAQNFKLTVMKIIADSPFKINHDKTRIIKQSRRQNLCGITVNTKTNMARKEFDSLKAIVHNCLKFGPESQNLAKHPEFRLHLLGRIQHLVLINSPRGMKLLEKFKKIDWPN